MLKQRRKAFGVALVLALLAGCAALTPGPRTVEVSEAQLAERLARQFPYSGRYLGVFDVVLSEPQLTLLPQTNRLATQLHYTLGGPLLGGRGYAGAMNLSYGLRFEPGDGSVRLADVRVDELQASSVPPAYQAQVSRLGAQLAEGLLQDYPVYTVKPKDLETARGWGYQPGALRVVPGGVQLQLEPIRR